MDGTVVDGQSEIMRTSGIERVWITPDDVRASDDALAAIAEAELIVLGPGSLYTSLLPSLLIPTIRDAIERTTAPRIYVCNVATQEGETTGFDLAAHVEALAANASPTLVDIVLANNHVVRDGRRGGRGARRGAGTEGDRPDRSSCAGRRPSTRSRDSSSTTSWTRSSRITTTRPGWRSRSSGRSRARPGSGAGRPADRPPGPPR